MGENLEFSGRREAAVPAANKAEFLRRTNEVVDEIQRHKWIESEKAGRDIGGNLAALDWMNRHYEEWKRQKGY